MSFYVATASPAPLHTIIRVWDESSWLMEVKAPPAVLDMKVYPSGKYFFLALVSGEVVVVNGAGQSKQIIKLPGLTAMALSKNGQFVAVGCAKGYIEVWQLPKDKEPRQKVATFRGHKGSVTCIAFENDNQTVLSGGTDQLLYRWDAETGKEIQCCEGHTSEISCIATTNGLGALSGGGIRDGTVRLWNLDIGAEVLATTPIEDGVGALALTKRGIAVIGTRSGSLKCWDLDKKTLQADLQLTMGPITGLSYSETEDTVVVGCQDGALFYLKPAESWATQQKHTAPGAVQALDGFPGGKTPDLT